MVKKFASITAMAKAEKRLSRRLPLQGNNQPQSASADYVDDMAVSANVSSPNVNAAAAATIGSPSVTITSSNFYPVTHENYLPAHENYSANAQSMASAVATIMATPPGTRVMPVRSMSLRERRSMDASPIPRSQSGNSSPMPPISCWSKSNQHSHPHVNLMHAEQHYNLLHAEQHYYSSPNQQQQQLHQQSQQVHKL